MPHSMPSSTRFPVTIYYEDTDAGGVVYHANYLKYFERARTEMLRHHGISQQVLLAQNIGFVVKNINIDYLKGAQLDDHLSVLTSLSERRRASMIFCQELVNHQNEVLCRAIVKVACIDTEQMKPRGIPEQVFAESCSEC